MSDRDEENGGEKSGGSAGVQKDDRMKELRAEIARLEERNEIIRKEYDPKFQRGLLRGVTQAPREPIKSLKHPVAVQQDEDNMISTSSSDTDVESSLSPVSPEQIFHVKKKIRPKDRKIAIRKGK